MLPSQKKYLRYLQELKEIITPFRCIDTDEINQLHNSLIEVELVVPVIGAFSAGKTTLINSFLGQNLLPVNITAETSLAMELRYSNIPHIVAVHSDSTEEEYSLDAMVEVIGRAKEWSYLKVFLENKNIKKIEPLILVDMPGFDSSLDAHNHAIMAYMGKGVYYAVLISSTEEANLTSSLIRQLEDIHELGRDFSVFLSKTNLRPASDVQELKEANEIHLEEIFGGNPSVTPLGLDSGEILGRLMEQVNPDELIHSLFYPLLKTHLYNVMEAINLSIDSLNRNREVNKQAIESLRKSIDTLENQREQIIQNSRVKYGSDQVERILNAIIRELERSIDELVAAALSGGEDTLSRKITEIVRHAMIRKVQEVSQEISEGLVSDFAGVLQTAQTDSVTIELGNRLLEQVASGLQTMIGNGSGILQTAMDRRQKNERNDTDTVYKTITTLLAITTIILKPVLKLLVTFLPGLLSSFFEDRRREKQRAELADKIQREVIPAVKRQLDEPIRQILIQQVEKMVNSVGNYFAAKLAEKKNLIEQMEKEKSPEIEATRFQIDEYEHGLSKIKKLAADVLVEEIGMKKVSV